MIIFFILTQLRWIETNQQDFNDGIYECNIYASLKEGGTIEFTTRWDLNCDGYLDLALANEFSDYVYVYWGSSAGYSSGNRTDYYAGGGTGDIEIGDIDFDGFPELFTTVDSRIRIFMGTPTGPNPNDYIDVNLNIGTETCYLADFNKDGYLDLVSSKYDVANGVVFWGSQTGYSPSNATFLPSYGHHNIEAGDFNRDGWADIVFINDTGDSVYVYWGSSSGFSPNLKDALENLYAYPHGCSVADVNGDGYLDIILTYFVEGMQSYIYTYTQDGFVLGQILNPGPCYGGSSIADFNGDNYLDILYLRGYGVDLKPIIYWGSAIGYSEANKTEIGQPVDASGALVADFNGDGILDVLINNYAYPPEPSYILLGPGYVPTYSLPTQRDHHSIFREIGNVYNRKYYEDYISSVFDAGEEVNWSIVDWDDSLPPGSSINFFVRSGNTPNPDNSWSDWDSLGKGEEIPDSLNSRYLQYRARLKYTNPAYLPYLFEVRIGYGPSVKLILEPNYADSTLPLVPVSYDLRVINIGIGLDTVDLRYEHNTNWQISLFDSTGTNPLIDHNNNSFPDVIININDTVPIVLTVTPPSGAQGGEIDSLRLIGNSNINPLLVDTAYITTRIRRVAGILIDPDQVGYTIAGVPKSYDLWIYNQGTNQDTVDLFYHHPKPWGIALLDSTGTMPLADHNNNNYPDLWVSSSDSVKFKLVVYSPDTASAGVADTLILTGCSSLNPLISDSAEVITIIEGMGSIIIFPDQQATGQPGNWVNFLITARNNQNFVDTIDLRYIDHLSYTYQFLDSLNNPLIDHNNNSLVDLPGIGPSGAEIDFNLRVLIPSNTPSGIRDTILIFGYSGRDTTIRDSSINILTVGTVAQVSLEPDRSDSGNVGDSIDYLLWVENLGNAGDVIDLSIIGGDFDYSLRDVNGNLLMDTDGDGMKDLGLVNGFGGCESLLVRVKIPPVVSGVIDTVLVRAYSSNNSAIYDDAVLKTGSLGGIWGLRIDPDQQSRVEVGKSVSYQLSAILQANLSDVVNIKRSGVVGGWGVELLDKNGNVLVDNNQDGLIDLGLVSPNVSEDFLVRVNAPDHFDFSGLLDTLIYFDLIIYGECSMRSEIRDSAFLRTILVPPFGVHNFRNPFKERTQFIFSLPKSGRVTLKIFTRAGELVRKLITDRHYDFGIHYYPWDGKNDAGQRLAPGVYIYVFDFIGDDGEHLTSKKKAVIIK